MSSPEPYPGTPKVERYVDGDDHMVILDLSPLAFPLDGIVPTLLRTISDEDVWHHAADASFDAASIAARHGSFNLAANPTIANVLRIPLTPDEAAQLRDLLDEAQLEPDRCTFPGCCSFAVAGEWCGPHQSDSEAIA